MALVEAALRPALGGGRRWGTIRGGLWAWEFEVVDDAGKAVAWINRKFPQGLGDLGREVFTDAGKYVVHLGDAQGEDGGGGRAQGQTRGGGREEGLVVRPAGLGLDERCVALAAAMSIDFDHFSRHSHGGFGMPMFFPMPIPPPMPPAEVGGGDGGEAGGAEGGGAGMGAPTVSPQGDTEGFAQEGKDFADEDPYWDQHGDGDEDYDGYGYGDEGDGWGTGDDDGWGSGGGGGGDGGDFFGGFFSDE